MSYSKFVWDTCVTFSIGNQLIRFMKQLFSIPQQIFVFSKSLSQHPIIFRVHTIPAQQDTISNSRATTPQQQNAIVTPCTLTHLSENLSGESVTIFVSPLGRIGPHQYISTRHWNASAAGIRIRACDPADTHILRRHGSPRLAWLSLKLGNTFLAIRLAICYIAYRHRRCTAPFIFIGLTCSQSQDVYSPVQYLRAIFNQVRMSLSLLFSTSDCWACHRTIASPSVSLWMLGTNHLNYRYLK